MIYYSRHIGDAMRDAAFLSLLEEGAFVRLADHYFSREEPLSLDIKICWRVARANTKAERAAVKRVLELMFEERETGFHRPTFDDQIGRAQGISEGRSKRSKSLWEKKRADANGLQMDSTCSPNQEPITNIQEKSITPPTLPDDSPARALVPSGAVGGATAAGEACRLMREAGATMTNPSHPGLHAALDLGCTPPELADTVREAIDQGINRPFHWAISTAKNRRARGEPPAGTYIPRGSNNATHRQPRESRSDRIERLNRDLDEREQSEAQAVAGSVIEHAG